MFTWACLEVLLSWTALLLGCLKACAPASTPHRLASPPFGHVACLGLAKTMPLDGCVRVMMTGEFECKGGPTHEGSLLGETAKLHKIGWLHEADKAINFFISDTLL